jgi:hypothetical protein
MEGVKSEKRGNFSREQLRKKRCAGNISRQSGGVGSHSPQARVAGKKTAKVFW